jgi:hypothetical protein
VRLPFPERFSLFQVAAFCLVLNVLQQIDGTSILFSACTTLFILIATVAFNAAGGLTRPSGGWIFAYTVLVVLFGISYKVLLGEPGQSNLLQPERTIEVYVVSISMMLVSVYLARKFTPAKSLFPQFSSVSDMGRAATACLVLGGTAQILPLFVAVSGGAGSFFSAFTQINLLPPLALILGVTYEIRRSGGRRSINIVVLLAGFLLFANGIVGYSKQGILGPFVIWLVVAASQRYKVSLVQLASLVLVFAFIVYYLVPYSQYGRNYLVEGSSFSESIKVNILLLSNLDKVRAAQLQSDARDNGSEDVIRFYNRPQGFADRLQMIAPDDALINSTENGTVFGIVPTIFAFENLIPHILWPGKPIINFGNVYAHEVGIISDDSDTTTGISFSPTGDIYHQAKWAGILLLLPLLLFMLFLVTDSCCGDTRSSPFALLAMFLFFHSAPEGGVVAIVHDSTFAIASLLLAAWITTKLMPFASKLFVSSSKERHAGMSSAVQPQRGHFATAVQDNLEAPLPTYRWSRPDLRQ